MRAKAGSSVESSPSHLLLSTPGATATSGHGSPSAAPPNSTPPRRWAFRSGSPVRRADRGITARSRPPLPAPSPASSPHYPSSIALPWPKRADAGTAPQPPAVAASTFSGFFEEGDDWRVRFGGGPRAGWLAALIGRRCVLATRCLLAAFALFMLAANLRVAARRYRLVLWAVYATHWNELFCAAALLCSACSALFAHGCREGSEADADAEAGATTDEHDRSPPPPPLAAHLALACHGVTLPCSAIVGAAFWGRYAMAGGTPFLLPPLSAAHAADSVQIVWNHGGQLVALVLESLVLTRPFRSTHVQSAVLVAVVFSYALFTYVYYLAGGTCPTRPGERYIYAQLQYGNPTFHGTNTAALAALAVTTIFLAAVHWRVGQKLAGAGKAGSLPPVGGDTWRRPGWCDRSAAVLSALIFTSAVVTFSAGSVR